MIEMWTLRLDQKLMRVAGFRSANWRKRATTLGFSLLELLVVVAVIALLLAILLPSYARVREDARRTMCLANLKNIGVALFEYSSEHRDYAPPVMQRIGRTAPRTLLSRSGEPVNLGLLWPESIGDTKSYLCPSQKKFNYRSEMDELHTSTIAGSYAYAVNQPANACPRFGALRHLAMVADDFVARHGDDGIGKYSHRVGYNVLYTDGSAIWWPDADESVWKRHIYWDDERDDINYQTLYTANVVVPDSEYGNALDIFRVWHAMCYSRPDEYPETSAPAP